MVKKFKIGQEVTVEDNCTISTVLSEGKIEVKKGDRGYIDASSDLHYTSGDAIGKIQRVENIELSGFDTKNIATIIFNSLNRNYNLEDYLENDDVSKNEVIDEIDFILSDIL